MKEQLWKHLKELRIPGFFITAEIKMEGEVFPAGIDYFIRHKFDAIRINGITARKFLFKEGEWIIYLTFFPTDRVVDKRFALMNKVASKKVKLNGHTDED